MEPSEDDQPETEQTEESQTEDVTASPLSDEYSSKALSGK